ncbi:MAG: DMT family transporter [Clostridia bacterium]|nr:DMT family transporter [Clostridia bacterium]MBR6602747.1 DMT family transporter [Clostridia bacterium]
MKKEQMTARLSLILSMTIFGTIGIFRKFIPLPSGFLAMTRGFIGAAFLIILMLLGKKRFDFAAVGKKIWLLIISGAFIGFNWILLFEAYNYTSVATATLCYYAAPIFVIIASPFLLGERLTAKKFVCVVISAIGMVAVSGVFDASFGGLRDLIGVFLGLGAALLYASVIILNKKIGKIPPYEKTAVQLSSAAIVILPYVLFAEEISAECFSTTSVIMTIVVGILHTGIAYALYFGSMSSLGAQTVALFSYIDPVVAIVLSAFVLKENIGVFGYIGAALVLGATLYSELPEKKS